MSKPSFTFKPCICGADDWRQREDGGWCCNSCHPNPNKEEKAPIVENPEGGKVAPELLALLDKVRGGNEKLMAAWMQIKMIENEERHGEELERWSEANEKLSSLCTQLMGMGYEGCLYIEDGIKTRKCLEGIGCRVCPSSKKYWEDELMGLPRPWVKPVEHGEETMKFLEKLGEI